MTAKNDAFATPPNMSPAIAARGLVKTFRNGKVRALDCIDFHAVSGDAIAIIGPSGGGKSTLLYALSGLIAPDRGEVEIYGRAPASATEWTRLRRQKIGLVFQDDWLLPNITAAENIELPMIGVEPVKVARQERVRWLLEQVQAEELGDRMPAALSGGERQRVAVARGLVNAPQILMADEPTGELDSVNSDAILALMFRLQIEANLTLLIVTHDPDIADRCHRRFVVQDGTGCYAD